MVDDISAAAFNVVFTSLPILLFAVLDRPVRHLDTFLRFPQVGPSPAVFFSSAAPPQSPRACALLPEFLVCPSGPAVADECRIVGIRGGGQSGLLYLL